MKKLVKDEVDAQSPEIKDAAPLRVDGTPFWIVNEFNFHGEGITAFAIAYGVHINTECIMHRFSEKRYTLYWRATTGLSSIYENKQTGPDSCVDDPENKWTLGQEVDWPLNVKLAWDDIFKYLEKSGVSKITGKTEFKTTA
jgi:hypothetical protein